MPPLAPAEDARFMRRALELAERGWGRVSPNPMVGAVVVRDGEPVGEGWHAEYGAAHAEIAALAQAGDRSRGATMYVSLEPCSHHGKTPPCSDAVIAAGIARLVYAASDPNPTARGGAERAAAAGIEVLGGVEEQRARDLNGPFFHTYGPAARDRPWIELKLALSLDSRISDRNGRSTWITSDAAREEVHRIRAAHDAVGVGIGTALADDPLLTARGRESPRRQPVRIVFDRRLRLPLDSRLASTAGESPVWVISDGEADEHAARALEATGSRVLAAGGLAEALRLIRARGIESLLVEGGAGIASALLDARMVDRLSLFYAPVLLGPEGASPFAGIESPQIGEAARWRHIGTRTFGPDTVITLAP